MDWAAHAQESIPENEVVTPKPLAIEDESKGKKLYHFTKEQASEAAEAVQKFLQMLQGLKPEKRGSSYQKVQVEVTFRDPIEKAKILALKVEGFHGPNGPPIRVQLLEEEQGKTFKPSDQGNRWHATTKGDARLFVLSLSIPPEEGTAKKTHQGVAAASGPQQRTQSRGGQRNLQKVRSQFHHALWEG